MKWEKPAMLGLDAVGPCHCPNPPLFDEICTKPALPDMDCISPNVFNL